MSTTTTAGGGRESGYPVLIVFLVLAIALAAGDFFLLNQKNGEDRQAVALTTQIQVLSQQTAKYALEAASGNIDAFRELESTRNTIDSAVKRLMNGHPGTALPAYAGNTLVARPVAALGQAWTRLDRDIGRILSNQRLVVESTHQADTFSQRMPTLNSQMDQVTSILQQHGTRQQTYTASRQMVLADRMIRRVQEILQGGDDAQAAADGLARDAQLYGTVLAGLLVGNNEIGVRALKEANARKILGDMQESWDTLLDPVHTLVAASPNLQEVKDAGNQASLDSQTVLLRANDVAERIARLPMQRLFPNIWWGLIAAAGAVAFALLLVFTLVRDQRRRFETTAALNQRNQEAIMRLLDEMGALAEGDLTVKSTVSEDMTGAIADAMNYAVDELRRLVATINHTAVRVSAAAQATQTTATHLAEAAEYQAQQISSASVAISDMAGSVDQVSKNSADSADVAQRSVRIASHGAGMVHETILGMESIRGQIQDTSRRVKRLGESSQEIGAIVELINDIAEQTNVLALNAAIQAASAGEAGRGFAVVADEVQRLAERSSSATRRIETLVRTIQSDTNEAVHSMERTTAEVVAGAHLAEDAGTALENIERVSNDLAELIGNISAEARQQSAAATHITSTMDAIQRITSQTSSGASQTAESIGNLAQLANDLRRSVADFKLPD